MDFPTTPGCYEESLTGKYDAFVTKVDVKWDRLQYSTYIGGSNYDTFNYSTINHDDQIILIRETVSNDFPTKNAFQKINGGGSDTFLITLHTAEPIPAINKYILFCLCLLFIIIISYFPSR